MALQSAVGCLMLREELKWCREQQATTSSCTAHQQCQYRSCAIHRLLQLAGCVLYELCSLLGSPEMLPVPSAAAYAEQLAAHYFLQHRQQQRRTSSLAAASIDGSQQLHKSETGIKAVCRVMTEAAPGQLTQYLEKANN